MFIISFFFLLGSSIGSFLDVLIDRLPRQESIIKGRSHCDSCKHTLAWFDLIPLFSFIFLRGTCRYCNAKIGWQNFVVQITTGLLFVFTFFVLGSHGGEYKDVLLRLVYIVFFLCCFLVIGVIDTNKGIIPDAIVFPAALISFSYHLLFFPTLLPFLLSAFVAGLFFFVLFAITRGRGMGFGDVKLAFLLGLFLGFPSIVVALYIAFLTGAIVALILVLTGKKKFSRGTIPFGPFMVLGAFIATFYGDVLWKYILGLLFRI